MRCLLATQEEYPSLVLIHPSSSAIQILKYVLIPSPLGLLSFLGLPVIFTLYTHHLGFLCRYIVVDDQRRQLPTFDTARIQAFAIFLYL